MGLGVGVRAGIITNYCRERQAHGQTPKRILAFYNYNVLQSSFQGWPAERLALNYIKRKTFSELNASEPGDIVSKIKMKRYNKKYNIYIYNIYRYNILSLGYIFLEYIY